MAINAWPLNAVSGVPAYSGKMVRQSMAPLFAGVSAARPLGARSGIRYGGGPPVTVTATQWTIQPLSGVLDLETSATTGGLLFAIDAAVTGTFTVADANNPRVDIVYVTENDPSESADGSTTPGVTTGYLAGAPAANPVAPATPARSMVLATLYIPKATTGPASAAIVAPFTANPGPVPVYNAASRDALTLYDGLQVYRLDTHVTELYRNSAWVANDRRVSGGTNSVTTNVNGDFTLPIPAGALSGTLLSYNFTDATDPASLGAIILKVTASTATLTGLTGRAYATTGAVLNTVTIALAWVAVTTGI